MSKFICIAVATFLLFAFGSTNSDLYERIEITAVTVGPIGSGDGSLAIARRNTNCGGRGKFIQARLDGSCGDCTCAVVADGRFKAIEVDFEPGAIISPVQLVIRDVDVNNVVIANVTIRNSYLTTGKQYTLKARIAPTEPAQGKTNKLRLALNDANTQTTDLCTETLIEFVRNL